MVSSPSRHVALPEELRYYIVRHGTTMIPMIPCDQLPFQIHGIPSQLAHRDISDQQWKFVAETSVDPMVLDAGGSGTKDCPLKDVPNSLPNQPERLSSDRPRAQILPGPRSVPRYVAPQRDHDTISNPISHPIQLSGNRQAYTAEIASVTQRARDSTTLPPLCSYRSMDDVVAEAQAAGRFNSQYRTPDHDVRNRVNQMEPSNSTEARPTCDPSPKNPSTVPRTHPAHLSEWRSTSGTKSLADLNAELYPEHARRLNYVPDSYSAGQQQKEKEFCTHWIQTGDCAFVHNPGGCRYKHVMPPVEQLRKMGFWETPSWYGHRTAIKKKTWMEEKIASNPPANLLDLDDSSDHHPSSRPVPVSSHSTILPIAQPVLISLTDNDKEPATSPEPSTQLKPMESMERLQQVVAQADLLHGTEAKTVPAAKSGLKHSKHAKSYASLSTTATPIKNETAKPPTKKKTYRGASSKRG